jgi:hypothetical protein
LSDAIATGTDVDLVLALVFEHGVRSDTLVLPARVVWCTPIDEAYQVGFVFRPLDSSRATYLAQFLKQLDDRELEQRARDNDVDDRFG